AAEAALDVILLEYQAAVGPLRSRQPPAVDDELVLLGLAAHDRMILEQQAAASGTAVLAEFIRCGHPGKTATDDDQVDLLVDRPCRRIGIEAVADAVGGFDHRLGVAVGPAVVTDAAVAGPGRTGGRQRYGAGRRGCRF